jgi:hypothetical protein
MKRSLVLKEIEKRAYRISRENGLFEFSIGLIYLGLFLSQFLHIMNIELPVNLFIGATPSLIMYWVIKKYIIAPRMGRVVFSSERKKRLKSLLYSLVIVVIVQIGGILLIKYYPASMKLGNDLIVSVILSLLFVFLPFSLISYYKDYLFGYFIAVVSSFIWPLTIIFDIYLNIPHLIKYLFLILGFVFCVIGVTKLIKFVTMYPIHDKSETP